MQNADQCEQPARGGEINIDFAVEPVLEQFGRFVMNAAPRHIDGLDLLRGSFADCLIIAVANREIIADRAAEAAQRQNERFQRLTVRAADVEYQTTFIDRQVQFIGPGIIIRIIAVRREMIFLDQVEDRDPPFLFDVGVAPEDRRFVELDLNDARVRHGGHR